jgi:predicted rRNA methylase YqxC with S4 and FtsJ domains
MKGIEPSPITGPEGNVEFLMATWRAETNGRSSEIPD